MKSLQGLHLHLDPVSGIAGDMTVAALVDAGVPPRVVVDAVAALGVPGLRVSFEIRRRGAFVGRGFVVKDSGLGGGARAKKAAARGGSPLLTSKGTKSQAAARALPQHDGSPHDHQHRHQQHGHDHDHGDHGHDHDHDHTDHGHDHHHHGHDDQEHHLAAVPGRRGRGSAHFTQPTQLVARRGRTSALGAPRERSRGGAPAHLHRDYADIRRLVARAKLPRQTKDLAQELFGKLASVEGALHGTPIDRVAFHEVGAFDSIADIVGMSAAITWLAPSAIGSSPPVVGTGTVRTAHGLVAVPAPATAALLRGLPMVADGEGELTTPTGAVLLATVVDMFGPPPPLRIAAIGYGAGTRELADRANVLRVILGEVIGQVLPNASEEVLVLETNLDDMTGQLLAALMEALFAAGAVDVWATPILMKKGRPAHQISALAAPAVLAAVQKAFFLNSTTLGIRIYPASRATLARSTAKVETAFGPIAIKVAALDGTPISSSPEYEDCRRAAARARVPVRKVWLEAQAAAHALAAPALSPRGAGGKARAPKGRKRKVSRP